MAIAGSISRSGTSVSGAVHVDGFNCFDRLTTIGLTGTLTGNNISLTSAPVDGQVITLNGSVTATDFTGTASDFTGTYTITGGCANGDHENVSGIKVPLITGQSAGTFTTSAGETLDAITQVTQGSASPEGTYGLAGTVTFTTSCLSSGTLKSGTFPSGSFILGRSVTLEIETDNGTIAFLGTADPVKGEIRGTYTLAGGTCDDTGTAILVAASPWDY